jgi:tRNA A-37 threonylcarbamoyl transferase component Bud32
MGCLDEQTVVAFVSGALTGPRLAEVERHLLGCADCAALVAVAVPAPIARPITLEWAGAPPVEGGPPPPTPARLSRAAPPMDIGATSPLVALSEPSSSGETVGRYRLLNLVGRGGMGEVYAAHDPDLDRKIAIKIMRGDTYPDEIEAARMMREARAIAKLSHPNLVTVYDVGSSSGRVFVAMELIEGDTVAAWLDAKRRTRDEILRVFIMAGRGLAAAHRAGIIHRDFKPQNVMVSPDGAVRVMDFGLAAIKQTLHGPKTPRLTRIGSILGTPLYMSPEQLCGQTVDPRADQFSFCVALYEALYGERPFAGENFAELRAAVLDGKPRPPTVSSRVPVRLRALLLRGLSVVPGKRFPDMDALLDVLEQISGRRTATARVLVIGTAAGALTFGLTFGLGWQLRAPHAPSRCAIPAQKLVASWPSAADAARRSQIRAAFLATNVVDARERFDRASQSLDTYASAWAAMSRQVCEAADSAAGEDRDLVGLRAACLDQRVDELSALVDAFSRADEKVVRKAVAATVALPSIDRCADVRALKASSRPSDEPSRARLRSLRTRLAALWAMAASGHDWQALKPMGALVDDARAAGNEPLLVEALLVYARTRAPFDPEGAEPIYEEAFKRGEAVHNDSLAAEAAIQLVAIAGIAHRFDTGERWARTADTTVERGVPLRMRGWFLHNRGTLMASRGMWRLAEGDFSTAVEIQQQALGAAHPDLAASMVDLARAVHVLDDPKRALEIANRALAISGGFFPAESYEVAAARLVRGQALIALGRGPDARADMETVLDTFERVLGRDHPFLADPLTGLGQVALSEGRPAEAQGFLERAWEIRSTHTADGGVREQTAFSLAQAIWDAAPADRRHALELASEAHDGYSAMPDLAPRLALVDRWLATHATRSASPRRDRM